MYLHIEECLSLAERGKALLSIVLPECLLLDVYFYPRYAVTRDQIQNTK